MTDKNQVHSMSERNATNQDNGVRAVFSDYGERTTLHGFYYLIHGGTSMRKFVWVVFILTAFGYLTYNAVKLFGKYFDYPTISKSRIVAQPDMLFPAVTICNYNPLRNVDKCDRITMAYFKNGTSKSNQLNRKSSGTSDADALRFYLECGHQMNEAGMLVECNWKGRSCNEANFSSTVQRMGLCHTFNSGKENHSLQRFSNPGESNGLILKLNVQTEDYLPVTPAVGVKVIIHDQHAPISTNENGFAVMPGRKALVSVTKKKVKTLGPPYGMPCNKSLKYSQEHCLSKCKQQYIFDHCKCLMPPPTTLGTTYCLLYEEKRQCYFAYEAKFFDLGVNNNCTCQGSCEKSTYDTDLSYAYLKPTSVKDLFMESDDSILLNSSQKIQWQEFVRDNILEISIYFNDLSYLEVEEVAAYPWESFVAEFGGTMGLCLGASLLTILELLDLIGCIISFFCRAKKG
ncbi:acid-sensing ion channel 1-like [Dendronephthya gigantea]|uniref:acid-sensing ion channel 1-like n=1 Tax=Dendronephthya gigantea TaxID=151771 RepID=UPI00106BE55C|nr:acid-sensing ion channel 1-like [Dendronephthya gigantea]